MRTAPLYNDVAKGPEGGAAYWVSAEDGTQLRIALWRASGAVGTILLFPGRTEYVEKYGIAAGQLNSRGYDVLAIDWRGQGLADRLVEPRLSGHVHDFADYQLDVAAMMRAAQDLNLPRPFYLIGHSMGGCIGLRTICTADVPITAAVFSAPMWGINLSRPMQTLAPLVASVAVKLGLAGRRPPSPGADADPVDEPFDNNMLTTDREQFEYMKAQLRAYPDLALGFPTFGWLHEAFRETRALAALPSPAVPGLSFLGTRERIVSAEAIQSRMERWSNGQLSIMDGCEHEVMMETPASRAAFFDQTTAFFRAHPE